ncbi:flagellar hook-associated protein FlgL [Ligilactobacillus sp. WILCCON 0076]|uniref:Flagellar hook-associated protein FlgL n=1 Tax=Ligilactobacillus ubinensis TaxID=2876789 RepID=A0A9X2FKV8_9LACO|nr:flagellar hook-associated protein FlgL [Ligilactobacillus ubinensis]MCP0886218.1 flagellar hook-associated protein FlgL [Ligilactobacillus ubinensis]
MRISSSMTYTNFLTNYQKNANTMQDTMNQLSSGKTVTESSDNPLLVSKIISSKVSLAENETYADTISSAETWTQEQYSVLNNVSTSMNRIITLITAAASSTNGTDELAAQKEEINEDIQNIMDSLNTNYAGKYLFSGQNTTTKPFEVSTDSDGIVSNISYEGTDDNLTRTIANGVSVDLFADGSQFTSIKNSDGTTTSLNEFVSNLMSALGDSDGNTNQTELGSTLLTQAQDFYDNFTSVQTNISAKETRLEAAASRNSTEKLNLTTQLSDQQDVDYAEAYLQYENQMVAYKATLAVGTKIMQTTVLDYMD